MSFGKSNYGMPGGNASTAHTMNNLMSKTAPTESEDLLSKVGSSVANNAGSAFSSSLGKTLGQTASKNILGAMGVGGSQTQHQPAGPGVNPVGMANMGNSLFHGFGGQNQPAAPGVNVGEGGDYTGGIPDDFSVSPETTQMPDMSNFNMPEFNMPDFNMPDMSNFNMPDFNMPDMSNFNMPDFSDIGEFGNDISSVAPDIGDLGEDFGGLEDLAEFF